MVLRRSGCRHWTTIEKIALSFISSVLDIAVVCTKDQAVSQRMVSSKVLSPCQAPGRDCLPIVEESDIRSKQRTARFCRYFHLWGNHAKEHMECTWEAQARHLRPAWRSSFNLAPLPSSSIRWFFLQSSGQISPVASLDDGLSIFGQFLPVFCSLSSSMAAKFSRNLHPGHTLSQSDRCMPQLHFCPIECIVRY